MPHSSLTLALQYDGRPVRLAGTADRPEWVALDVCGVLGISNARDALARFDEDEKGVALTDTLGGRQELATVTEPGLYRLIFRSRKRAAHNFRRWVFHEVLPSLRAHGVYPPPAPAPTTEPGLFGPIPLKLQRQAQGIIAVSVRPKGDLITLAAVPFIPWLPPSARPSVRTVREWHRFGRRGIYLETARVSGRLFTTEACVLEFCRALAQPNPRTAPAAEAAAMLPSHFTGGSQ